MTSGHLNNTAFKMKKTDPKSFGKNKIKQGL